MRQLIIILILVNFSLISGQDTAITIFDTYVTEVNNLEKQQKYNEAIELTLKIQDQFPDRKFEFIKELEYLYGKTKQYEKNLTLWEKGHEQGFFFLLHNRIKKFEPYLQFLQFDSLVQKDAQLREAAQTKAKTIYQIVKPSNFNPEKKYPLLLILHGGGSNLEMVMKRWKLLPSFKNDFLVAYFQSYRHYDSKTYGWVSSDSRAH
ncbi:MAG: hypothetical protein GF353_30165, partial [Candidatus Lokiarchaeota archaeon]|nr:hypothetical protein [Candidatus Lokiarchaeota archaeon]